MRESLGAGSDDEGQDHVDERCTTCPAICVESVGAMGEGGHHEDSMLLGFPWRYIKDMLMRDIRIPQHPASQSSLYV